MGHPETVISIEHRERHAELSVMSHPKTVISTEHREWRDPRIALFSASLQISEGLR